MATSLQLYMVVSFTGQEKLAMKRGSTVLHYVFRRNSILISSLDSLPRVQQLRSYTIVTSHRSQTRRRLPLAPFSRWRPIVWTGNAIANLLEQTLEHASPLTPHAKQLHGTLTLMTMWSVFMDFDWNLSIATVGPDEFPDALADAAGTTSGSPVTVLGGVPLSRDFSFVRIEWS